MTGKADVSETDLHAYIDGALEGARLREVEAAIGADSTLAERIAGFKADKAMLARIYAPLAERPLPAEWLALAHGKSAAVSATNWRRLAAIAAVMMIALAGALGYWRSQPAPTGEIVQAALEAREQMRHEKVIAVAQDAKVGQYDAVLKGAVAMNVKVPDLARMGYHLAGLHLYARPGRAAELLYRDAQGRLFTLYVRHSDGAARFDQFERRGLRVCVWQDEELGTVMVGNVSTAAMQRLASLAYTGLTL